MKASHPGFLDAAQLQQSFGQFAIPTRSALVEADSNDFLDRALDGTACNLKVPFEQFQLVHAGSALFDVRERLSQALTYIASCASSWSRLEVSFHAAQNRRLREVVRTRRLSADETSDSDFAILSYRFGGVSGAALLEFLANDDTLAPKKLLTLPGPCDQDAQQKSCEACTASGDWTVARTVRSLRIPKVGL
jgi:hypothetical protein